MKRIVKRTRLQFFQDDATGEFGVSHPFTINDYEGFNAFWNGIGIFHDIFEHDHEFVHKYFRGDNAMNIGGEMCAMGHLWYYYNVLGVGGRMKDDYNWFTGENNIIASTSHMVQEAIQEGYCQFGSILNCAVPKQERCNDSELEYQIGEYYKKVKKWEYRRDEDGGNNIEFSKEYKKSVTFRKIADLHRYGYRMAEKLAPNNWKNRETMNSFIEFWDKFCKNNNAEKLMNLFRYIEFTIYREEEIISWKAKLISNNYEINNYNIENVHSVLEDNSIYKNSY